MGCGKNPPDHIHRWKIIVKPPVRLFVFHRIYRVEDSRRLKYFLETRHMDKSPDLTRMTKVELIALARRKKIKTPASMRKNELVKAVKRGLVKLEAAKKPKPAAPSKKKVTKKSVLKKSTPAKTKKPVAKKSSAKKTIAKKAPASRSPKPEATELPASYGDNRLVVMARDPNWAYAYWDLAPDRLRDCSRNARSTAGEPRWILRVYSAGAEEGSYFDIVIKVESRSYYLNLSRPGARFVVAIGVVDSSGIFRTATESDPVSMPLGQPSKTVAPQGNPAQPTPTVPIALK